jgi:hypothetical protein
MRQNFDNSRMHLSVGFDSVCLIGVNRRSPLCCCSCFRHDGDLNWLALSDRITFGLITLPKYWFTSLFKRALVVTDFKANNLINFENILTHKYIPNISLRYG